MKRAFLSSVSWLLTPVFLVSCGYHISGHANMMPKTIRTIAVPAFANNSSNHRLPVLLTAATTRELISRTRYRIVANPDEADATLYATVARLDIFPIISDPNSSRSTGVQVVVTMQIKLIDRQTGKVLYSESGTAIERVSRDVARSIVSAILEGF